MAASALVLTLCSACMPLVGGRVDTSATIVSKEAPSTLVSTTGLRCPVNPLVYAAVSVGDRLPECEWRTSSGKAVSDMVAPTGKGEPTGGAAGASDTPSSTPPASSAPWWWPFGRSKR
jgi:hypothetical protein